MAFVDDIDFITGLNWGKLRPFNEFANVVDSGVTGGINFDHI
jgi:hypothetical protein